jgi:hypothetical protein
MLTEGSTEKLNRTKTLYRNNGISEMAQVLGFHQLGKAYFG